MGAAISAFPPDAKIGAETEANECHCKTASWELISDRGGLRVQGTTECGYGITFQGRKADVHKTLISVSKVQSKGHIAVVDSNGGCIILYNNALAREIQHYVQNEIVNECCKLYTKTTHILNYRTRDFFSRGSRLSQGTSLCLWLVKQSSSHLARHVSCAVVVVPLLDLFCTFHALPNRLP